MNVSVNKEYGMSKTLLYCRWLHHVYEFFTWCISDWGGKWWRRCWKV